MKPPRFPINWRPSAQPRMAAAVVASGTVARRLVEKILPLDDLALARWTGVAVSKGVGGPDGGNEAAERCTDRNGSTLVVLGESDSLPWLDGVSYLGWDERAPHLLLPTNREPDVPLDLLQRALIQRSPYPPPLAVVDVLNLVISLSQARELSREVLVAWLRAAA